MERSQRRFALRAVDRRQHRKRRQHVGHVLPGIELRLGQRDALGFAARGEIGEARIAQRAPADGGAVDAIRRRYRSAARTLRAMRRAAPGRSPRARRRAPRGSHRHRRPPSDRPGTPRPAAPAPRRRTPDRHRRRAAWPPSPRSAPGRAPAPRHAATPPPSPAAAAWRIAAPTPSARTDRCRARRGTAAAPAACPTASPARKSRAAATAPAAPPRRRTRSSAPPRRTAACARRSRGRLPSSSPIATGMTNGCLSGCPGVGGVRCASVSV